jgi:hypothetical protein
LRFVQALSGQPSITLYHNKTVVAANLAYSNATGYFSINSGDRITAVVGNNGATVLNTNVSITSGGNETLLLTGSGGSNQTLLLQDGGTTAVTGNDHVRVVNAATAAGTPDVYIVPAGTNITGIAPTKSMLAFNADTGYQLVPVPSAGGTYEVILTAPGTKNAVFDTGPIAFGTSANQTVVALDGTSTGFMFVALADQ